MFTKEHKKGHDTNNNSTISSLKVSLKQDDMPSETLFSSHLLERKKKSKIQKKCNRKRKCMSYVSICISLSSSILACIRRNGWRIKNMGFHSFYLFMLRQEVPCMKLQGQPTD